MSRIFAGFEIDRQSFWLGFLAASLFWAFVILIRPFISRMLAGLRARSQAFRQEMMTGVDTRLNNDTLQLAQKLHLSERLFALDEILITPRLLAPPLQILPDESVPVEDIITELLPYTPDWPELSVLYGAPTLTLAEALQESPRLVLMGRQGSGKTVALLQLAIQIIRKEELPGTLNKRTPLFIHAGDLNLPARNPENLLETINDAIAHYASVLTLPRLLAHLDHLFKNDLALLLVDGLDELPPNNIVEIVYFIGELLKIFPPTPVVITSSLDFYDGITAFDFAPVAMANWDDNQRAEFIRNWGQHWEQYVGRNYEGPEGTDSLLLNAWMLQDHSPMSPLEITLKVWATYAGDTLGPKPIHALEAYLRRMTTDIADGRVALEKIALGIISTGKPIFTQQDAEEWLSDSRPNPLNDSQLEQLEQPITDNTSQQRQAGKISASRVLPDLQSYGLISTCREGRLKLIHPQILSFLGGCSLTANTVQIDFIDKQDWNSAASSLGYFAANGNADTHIAAYLQKSTSPIYHQLFNAALWLRDSQTKASWRVNIVRELVNIIRDESAPLGLRVRAATALATCGVQGIESLYQQLMSSSESNLRMISALGSGLIGDSAIVESLIKLVGDTEMNVRRAACFALVAAGNQTALETIADALLHGDEDLRRAAAEALANHREEGYPTLKDGATLDDILVRRATTYGLRRIKQGWAMQLLEQMQIEDSQWAVKNVAAQALVEMNQPNPRLPKAVPTLTETPWLIAFAGERGLGVSPGKPAKALIMQALIEGTAEQKLAALNYLLRHAVEEDLQPITKLLASNQVEIRESAYNTIWHLALAGLRLPEQQ